MATPPLFSQAIAHALFVPRLADNVLDSQVMKLKLNFHFFVVMKVENKQLLQLRKGSLKKKKRACMGFELSTSAIEQTSQLGIMGKGEHSSVIIV